MPPSCHCRLLALAVHRTFCLLIDETVMRRLPAVSPSLARLVNAAIPALLILHGATTGGLPWIKIQLHTFGVLMVGICVCCSGTQYISCKYGARLQPDKPHAFTVDGDQAALLLLCEEIFETSRCMFVISCMAAWPLSRFAAGGPSGLIWTLDEVGLSVRGYLLGFIVGIPVADAWLYLKHRLLHTPTLWAFHAHHHSFRNPTAFGGFAVSPFEAIWTFAPIFLWSHLPHWIPLVAPSIFAFFVLNTYLHAGFSFAILESILPLLMLNSSCYHNVHHEKMSTHFGEIFSLWDFMLGTSAIYSDGRLEGYRWHLRRHVERSGSAASMAKIK